MHLDSLINHLNAAGTGIDFRNPDNLTPASADASAILYGFVNPVVDCYPSKIKEGAAYPVAAYEPVGVEWFGDEDLKLFRTDKMVLTIKADTLDESLSLIDQIETAVLSAQVNNVLTGIEVVDTAIGIEAERNKRIVAIEFDITTFNSSAQSLPAAFVYQSSQAATELVTTSNRQTHTYKFEVLVVAPSLEIDAKREAVRAALVGYQPGNWPVEYTQGQRLGTIGKYSVWRDSYQYKQILT